MTTNNVVFNIRLFWIISSEILQFYNMQISELEISKIELIHFY